MCRIESDAFPVEKSCRLSICDGRCHDIMSDVTTLLTLRMVQHDRFSGE